jgi:hypothetical protein
MNETLSNLVRHGIFLVPPLARKQFHDRRILGGRLVQERFVEHHMRHRAAVKAGVGNRQVIVRC